MSTTRAKHGCVAAAGAAVLLLSACGSTGTGTDSDDTAADDAVSDYADCVVTDGLADATEMETDGKTELTVAAFNGWDDTQGSAYMAKHVLEDMGYSVTVESFEAAPGFTAAANGDVDWLASSMLPRTHADYLEQYGDDYESLGCWYEDARNAIAVNADSPARTIADLQDMEDEYGKRIVGIEAGAGLMRATEDDVMPAYGLDDWQLVESSTPAMLAEVDSAEGTDKNVAVTMWYPHWAWNVYDLRELEDTEGAFGEADQFFMFAQDGFSDENPQVAQVLKNFVFSEEDFGELQTLMSQKYGGEDHAAAVADWAEENPEFFEDWKTGQLS